MSLIYFYRERGLSTWTATRQACPKLRFNTMADIVSMAFPAGTRLDSEPVTLALMSLQAAFTAGAEAGRREKADDIRKVLGVDRAAFGPRPRH